ncbi:hypothetical protein K7711_32420 [Nocardia sp. CA2R105]|uniref:hypothetical protein n=1 Tax=Nocardia coffeae TaxID=2873381 RepID=UPI001CA63362|nr:hypothetical protein [Nocardia coffeae]MBY8861221.1 hypothetical protein [Nocardia coffeae]
MNSDNELWPVASRVDVPAVTFIVTELGSKKPYMLNLFDADIDTMDQNCLAGLVCGGGQ